jgi:hypothetical protein
VILPILALLQLYYQVTWTSLDYFVKKLLNSRIH